MQLVAMKDYSSPLCSLGWRKMCGIFRCAKEQVEATAIAKKGIVVSTVVDVSLLQGNKGIMPRHCIRYNGARSPEEDRTIREVAGRKFLPATLARSASEYSGT
jgi:tRNA G26 N,N-dimethylase Trm1